jgi:hypothetical protein
VTCAEAIQIDKREIPQIRSVFLSQCDEMVRKAGVHFRLASDAFNSHPCVEKSR